VANQPAWLNTSYATGQLAAYPGVPVGLGASVNPAGLIPGIYTTNVTLTGNFVGSPKVISVVLIVNPPTLPLTITTNSSLPSATVGTYYSLDIIPDGGLIRTNSGNVSWGIISGSLPSGLATGSGSSTCANVGCMGIGGTPTTASTYNFTLSVSDGASSVSKSFVLVVNPVFPSCTPPPSCPAPTGCTYTGKTTCSCGTLVCPTPTPTSTPTLTPIPTITSTKTYSLSEIYDGDLIRGQGDIAVWIVKTVGEKRYKRWLFGPQIFNAYGHLGFNKVKNVSKETLNHFDTSNLIRKDGDTKVYELTDFRPGISATRRWIPTAEIFLQRGFDFDSVYVVNQVEFNLYTEGSPLPITQSAPVDNASLTANMSEVMLKFLGLER